MNTLKRILVVMGDDDRGLPALEHAQRLAAVHGAALTVVDVKPYLDAYVEALADIMPEDELRALVLDHRRKQLERLLAQHKTPESEAAKAKVLDGVPFIEIIREVLDNGHDLIVKTAEGDIGPGERLFGSTEMHLMRKSPTPVWVLNPDEAVPAKHVLAAIDVLASDEESVLFNRRILSLAHAVANVSDAKLHLLSAWRLVGEQTMRQSPFLKIEARRVDDLLRQTEDRLTQRQSELAAWFGKTYPNAPPLICHREKGEAHEVIQTFVPNHDIDIAVMGTVGRIDIPGLLIGNTAESVLSKVNCSVLTVKPEGFLTPVAGA